MTTSKYGGTPRPSTSREWMPPPPPPPRIPRVAFQRIAETAADQRPREPPVLWTTRLQQTPLARDGVWSPPSDEPGSASGSVHSRGAVEALPAHPEVGRTARWLEPKVVGDTVVHNVPKIAATIFGSLDKRGLDHMDFATLYQLAENLGWMPLRRNFWKEEFEEDFGQILQWLKQDVNDVDGRTILLPAFARLVMDKTGPPLFQQFTPEELRHRLRAQKYEVDVVSPDSDHPGWPYALQWCEKLLEQPNVGPSELAEFLRQPVCMQNRLQQFLGVNGKHSEYFKHIMLCNHRQAWFEGRRHAGVPYGHFEETTPDFGIEAPEAREVKRARTAEAPTAPTGDWDPHWFDYKWRKVGGCYLSFRGELHIFVNGEEAPDLSNATWKGKMLFQQMNIHAEPDCKEGRDMPGVAADLSFFQLQQLRVIVSGSRQKTRNQAKYFGLVLAAYLDGSIPFPKKLSEHLSVMVTDVKAFANKWFANQQEVIVYENSRLGPGPVS